MITIISPFVSTAALLRVACVEPDGARIDVGKVLMHATRSAARTIVNPTRFALRVRLALPAGASWWGGQRMGRGGQSWH